MILRSPFHERTSVLNETGLWSHWSGHLAADRYQFSDKFEYFAVRNGAGVFDSSALYKYRIHGPDAERFLAGVLAPDIRTCPPGHAHYTAWCDDSRIPQPLRAAGQRKNPGRSDPGFGWRRLVAGVGFEPTTFGL
jgi:aminomethyltransferase